MMEDQTTKSSTSLLGGLSVEILMKILDYLSNKDKFIMCQVSSGYNILVHKCTRWDLDLREDASSRLSRFSSTVNVIKKLKMTNSSYTRRHEEVKDGDLTSEDFYDFFKMHPELEYLYFNAIDSETLSYIAHWCTGLKVLKTTLYSKVSSEFKLGFKSLETLYLSVYIMDKSSSEAENAHLIIKQIASLPKLQILKLDMGYLGVTQLSKRHFVEQWPKMKLLQSLELNISAESITSKMIKSCPRILANVYVEGISDADFHILIDNCPNLKSVGIKYGDISHEGYAALFAKLGKQLQYLHLAEANFREEDMKALIQADATHLKALDLDFDTRDYHHVRSKVFVNLIQKYGGQLDRLNIWGSDGADDVVVSAVLDKCPSVVEQGIWKIDTWNITRPGVSKLISECGPSIRSVRMPSGCSDKDLKKLATNCPNLHTLGLGYNYSGVTTNGLIKAIEKCTGWNFLNSLYLKVILSLFLAFPPCLI